MLKKILLLTALTTLSLGFGTQTMASDENPSSEGRQLFNSYCFLCHGATGRGNGSLAIKLGITESVADLTDRKYGGMETKELAMLIAGYNRKPSLMPAWGGTLNAKQITAIATYIHTLSLRGSYISGKGIYYSTCAVCHGARGKGGGAVAKQLELTDRIPDLTTPKYTQMSEAKLIETIVNYSTMDDKFEKWDTRLNERALKDVASYIRLNPTGLQTLGNSVNGKTVFLRNCIACHGKEGKGDGILAGLLNATMINYTTKDSANISDTELVHVISMGRGEFMPGWFSELSEYDIRDVAAYVRTLYKKD
ncbi:MAG: c-type cytochrome [Porticoccus sp.]